MQVETKYTCYFGNNYISWILNITLAGSTASAAESDFETSGNLTDDPHGDSQESGPWPHHAGTATGPA